MEGPLMTAAKKQPVRRAQQWEIYLPGGMFSPETTITPAMFRQPECITRAKVWPSLSWRPSYLLLLVLVGTLLLAWALGRAVAQDDERSRPTTGPEARGLVATMLPTNTFSSRTGSVGPAHLALPRAARFT
ncbi:hypothetical protein N657DRAFT_639257 [Parathielavia appendiculata]|uniref:Uncharacterized protein n=1 Tax=Parathielavia appendiculata TaxID=2587402 RepID=A0AAN6Z7M2_9PEZI|nr:hypothetical protein N657DRAFT_639257 [Parathielavia appendiculata]